ncbi:MAG: acetate--CoA ligase family protein [Treponemataceae bacterium]
MRRLFNPTRIGIIGATETPGKVGRIVFDYLRRSSAELFPVNPKIQTILGYPVLPSTENLPEDLDLVVVTIGAAAAVEAAETCARKKAANIIIIAGGFGETGAEGRLLEERLKTLPAKYGSRILGPNSLGVFVPSAKLDTIFVEHGDAALAGGGGIAFITQSGSVGVESLGLASNTGFGLRAFVGIGNKADLDESDFLTWFGSDSGTDTLALYVESIEKGRLFLEQARGIARRKPLVLLKAGRTLAGASAASSHTGRLAGSDNVVSGALRQYGIQRAFDDEELCDAAKTLSMVKPAAGNRVAVITAAGGFGVMCTDYIDTPDRHAPLRMAVLSEKTKERIRFGTLPFASVHNPVDLTAGADDAMYLLALDALLADEGVDIVICVTFFAPPSITDMLSEKMAAVIRKAEKPVLVFTQYGPFTDTYLKNFYKSGVAGFSSLSRVVRAARFLVERSRNLRHLKEAPAAPFAPTADYQDIFSAWKQRLEVPGHANEWEAKLLMRSAGLPVPPGYLLSPRDPLPNVETLSAAGIAPPYAVKLCSARVLHKTDVGGVVLGVEAKDLHPVLESARRKFPGENLLIGSMLPIRGPEFIIGALKDPAFGAAIMVGVGGILTELYRDVSFRLAPCDPREVERMLMELTVAPILNGFRGSKADLAQLVAIIARFSEMAAVVVESGAQMDINPIIWNGESWFVLDAKVVL